MDCRGLFTSSDGPCKVARQHWASECSVKFGYVTLLSCGGLEELPDSIELVTALMEVKFRVCIRDRGLPSSSSLLYETGQLVLCDCSLHSFVFS